jgi:hypothetical protein
VGHAAGGRCNLKGLRRSSCRISDQGSFETNTKESYRTVLDRLSDLTING